MMRTLVVLTMLAPATCWRAAALRSVRSHDQRASVMMAAPYARDGDEASMSLSVDEKQVEALIADRNAFRRERRYEEADAVREELRGMGVNLYDKEKVWVLGNSQPQQRRRSDYNRGSPNAYDRGDRGGYGRGEASGYGSYQERRIDPSDGGSFTQREFEDFYGPREWRRRWESAASTRGSSNARSGGGRDTGYGARGERQARPPRERVFNEFGHDYERSIKDRTPLEGEALARVHEMIKLRMEAKFSRDYAKADSLKEELLTAYGVTIDDGRKEWRADGLSFVPVYEPTGAVPEEVDVEQITALTKERMAARKRGDYRRADEVLEELLQVGIVLVDKEYTWRFVGEGHDGLYGEGGSYGRRADASVRATPGAMGEHDYVREQPTGELTALDPKVECEIDALLAQRLGLKKARRFDEADSLQRELYDMYGVEVDDRACTWYVSA